jgi:hypothetical protein
LAEVASDGGGDGEESKKDFGRLNYFEKPMDVSMD